MMENGLQRPKKHGIDSTLRAVLKFGFVILDIAMAMGLAAEVAGSEVARGIAETYGYYGVFILAVISGFNLIVPIPAVALMPVFVVAGLDIGTTILVIAVGMTIADILAFLIGTSGRQLLEAKRQRVPMLDKLTKFRERNARLPLLVMFLYSAAVPFPNEVLAIPFGLMGYRIRDIILPMLLGNLVFNAIAAHALFGAFRAL
jgi:membrane protein YqaA with SNARE-associated domain